MTDMSDENSPNDPWGAWAKRILEEQKKQDLALERTNVLPPRGRTNIPARGKPNINERLTPLFDSTFKGVKGAPRIAPTPKEKGVPRERSKPTNVSSKTNYVPSAREGALLKLLSSWGSVGARASGKSANLPDLIRNQDGTLTVPTAWLTRRGSHTQEERRLIIGASNRLKRTISTLEKTNRRANQSLIASHQETLLTILRCI